ncbi:MAG TPA: tetratricopeptide repeat protein, partial [Planctomycetota bacterium]|nr:tetratricopeptide repeat protein [Planctomycetota bacterium]
TRRPETSACAGAEQLLSGVWDAERKQALHAAFIATGSAVAERQWQDVERTLDRYAADWVARRTDVCAATGPRPELTDARLACLDQRLENLRGWVGVFERADARVIERAAESARGRDDLQMCGDPAPALQPVPHDLDLRGRVLRLRGLLEAQRVRTRVGAHDAAFVALLGLQAAARSLGYAPLECEVVDALAYNHQARDRYDDAIAYYRRAGELAEEARYDIMRARTWTGLAYVFDFLYRYDESETAARYAEAVLKPMAGRQVETERLRIELVGALNVWGRGKREEAATLMRRLLVGFERHHGGDSFELATLLFEDGGLLVELGRLEEADAAFTLAETIVREVGGETHPMLAKILGERGNLAFKRGDYATALAQQRRSLALKLRRAPPDSLTIGIVRANLGQALLRLNRPDEALAELGAARAIMARTLGPKN